MAKKKSNSLSFMFALTLVILISYMGYREYNLNKILAKNEIAFQQLKNQVKKQAMVQVSAPGEDVNTKNLDAGASSLVVGYYCSRDPFMAHFKEDGTVTAWEGDTKTDTLLKSKPMFNGRFQTINKFVNMQLDWSDGSKEELVYKIYELDSNTGYSVQAMKTADGDILSKKLCR